MESDRKNILIIRAITALARKINKNFSYPMTLYYQNGVKMGIGKLDSLYGGRASDERISDYIAYQIYRMRESIASGRWSVTWIFSDEAVERYKRQFIDPNGKAGMMYYIDEWLRSFGIDRNVIAKALSAEKSVAGQYRQSDYEEPIKLRFHNTEAGYLLCLQTTGWSPKSNACKKCKYSSDCIERTKRRFPEIYRMRITNNQ